MPIPADIVNRCGRFYLEPTGFPRYETVVRDPWTGCCAITFDNDVMNVAAQLDEYFHEHNRSIPC